MMTLKLPPYSYVPGGPWPHPKSNPAGHSFGRPEPEVGPIHLESLFESELFRHGIDLFNHGFYWESHEAWETLWHAAGRTGTAAVLLKSLIKLAAAGVKVREGCPNGVRTHAKRAAELLEHLIANTPALDQRMNLSELCTNIKKRADMSDAQNTTPIHRSSAIVFDFQIVLYVK